MTTLTTPQTHALRDQLLARKEQLLQELDAVQVAHRERMKSADSAPQDAYATQANQVAQSAVRDAEARRDHDELVAVRAALERIADGSYGECLDCGQGVGLARLQAQPQALRCVGCQSKAETRHH